MLYSANIPTLSVSPTTYRALTNAPDLYLYGSLLEAEPFLMNDQRAFQVWLPGFEKAVQDIQDQDALDEFSGSELRVRNLGGYP